MRLLDSASPMQWVGLAATGCAFMLTGYITVDHLHHLPHGLGIASFVFLNVIGLWLSVVAQSRLMHGFENGQWSEQQRGSIRALTQHPAFACVQCLLFGLFLARPFLHFVSPALQGGLFTVSWPAFWMLIVSGQFRAAANRQAKSAPTSNWADAAPIQSEHWGNRSATE